MVLNCADLSLFEGRGLSLAYRGMAVGVFFFFQKQKTACERGVRLVGSEMCRREGGVAGGETNNRWITVAQRRTRRRLLMDPILVKQAASLKWAAYREDMVRHRLLGTSEPRIRRRLQRRGNADVDQD